jgi:glutathione synthase/RimK-type ligase-like ATP-grasp enzyme
VDLTLLVHEAQAGNESDMTADSKPIAIYYEHPDWFRLLFEELDRRAVPYVRIDAASHHYDPSYTACEYLLLFNRMSASAYLRGHGNAIFHTRNFLEHLESAGTRVINGSRSFAIETSKALQLSLLQSLGLSSPRTRVINSAAQLADAARDLQFPVVVKPNIGGRGAGIVRYESITALLHAAQDGSIDLGPDSTALVQEFVPSRGGHITRVETLRGKYLYAIKVFPNGESFNLCPAEICRVEESARAITEMCLVDPPQNGLRVEACTPPPGVIETIERIATAAKMDLGGIEYIIDDRDGSLLYYDINALSNFVADAPRVIGFDPHARLVDFLEEEASKCATVTGSRFLAVG